MNERLKKVRAKEAVTAKLTDLQQDPSSPAAGAAGGVTIVEFFDYHCGYCRRARRTSSLEEPYEFIENGTGYPQPCCTSRQAR